MIDDSRRSEFLDHLYAAAVGAEDWKNVLSSFTGLVGGHGGLLNFYDVAAGRVRTLEWYNYSEKHIALSDAYWQAHDPWGAAGQKFFRQSQAQLADGFVSWGTALVPQKELLATEWYNEFAAESLVQDCLSTVGVTSGHIGLALIANTGGHPPKAYKEEQIAEARRVQVDVQRAMNLHIRAGGAGRYAASVPGEMRMKVPAVTLKDRRILASNPEAQQELAKGRLISMERASRLSAQDPELDGMISVMCRPDGPQQASCLATAIDGSRFLAQAVRFNRLRGTLMEAAGVDDPALMLVLTPVDDRVAGREAALRAFSSFTPMEGAIAMALVNGQSISDIARERRISIPTIRWHIRNMIEKTGENGVRGLTRILTLLLPY